MMMKNLGIFLASLFLWNDLLVSADTDLCSGLRLTFNLKPKFPYQNSVDYVCNDLENQKIETMITEKVKNVMTGYGYEGVTVSNIRTDTCTNYGCKNNPGHKCLPYCVDVEFCVGAALHEATGVAVVSTTHLQQLAQDEIDVLRADLPDCLGIKNQFMLDIHFDMVST